MLILTASYRSALPCNSVKCLGWLFVIIKEENNCSLFVLRPVSQFPPPAPAAAGFTFVFSAAEV